MIDNIDIYKKYIIYSKDYVAKITPIDYVSQSINSEIFFPSAYANFSECENKLRITHGISSPNKITFIQIEVNNTIDNILVNQLEYAAYYGKIPLNLSICENANINLNYYFKNGTQEKIDFITSYREKGIDVLDINDIFFNDVCLPYSESGKDFTLNVRIREIFKNYTFCEQNCEIDEIFFDEMRVSCNCTIKKNIDALNLNFDLNRYNHTRNENFKIIKCYNAFTALTKNMGNFGFWIFLFLMIINIILLILFCIGFKKTNSYISKEMVRKGYIKQSDEGHAFCHNYVKKLDRLITRLNEMKTKFMDKNKKAPPKRKIRVLTESLSSKNIILTTDKNKKKKIFDENSMDKKIESLKERMMKTKKNQKKSLFNKSNKSDKANKVKVYKGPKRSIITESPNIQNLSINKKRTFETNKELEPQENNEFKINLINVNLNEIKKNDYISPESNLVLDVYNYEEAIINDKRSFYKIFQIFTAAKEIFTHVFLYNSPIERLPIRLSVFKFLISSDIALNAIFYTADKITDYYYSNKSLILLSFTNNITIIIIVLFIGLFLKIFSLHLVNSSKEIRNLFAEEEDKLKKNPRYIVPVEKKKEIILQIKRIIKKFKKKVIIFYIIEFIIMLFYWYYVTIFCYIYNKTVKSWLINIIITIILRFIIDIFLFALISFLYRRSIDCKCNCLYKTIVFFYCFV